MYNNVSRRNFLARSAAAGSFLYLLPHGVTAELAQASEREDLAQPPAPFTAGPDFFTDDERKTLASLCHQILPGSAKAGAVVFIENLLTAFDSDPPRIYAGGPFSGRAPFAQNGAPTGNYPQDTFAEFVPLNRVQAAAWKLRIYGSAAFPNGWWNESVLGPCVGLRDLFKSELPKALDPDGGDPSFDHTLSAFKDQMTELVVDACFSAPEYGGNQELHAWKLVHYPGDSQPLGYSLYDESTGKYQERADAPVSAFDSVDPDQMGFITKAFCFFMTLFEGGRIF